MLFSEKEFLMKEKEDLVSTLKKVKDLVEKINTEDQAVKFCILEDIDEAVKNCSN
jgi:hypothetical protein